MGKITIVALLLLVGVLLTNCKESAGSEPCQAPTDIVVKAPCENGGPGTLLIPLNFKVASGTQFSYTVFPQPDTLSPNLALFTSQWGNSSVGQILVPDSILANSPMFAARIDFVCQGIPKQSIYFGWYVKRQTNRVGCYTWVRKDIQ